MNLTRRSGVILIACLTIFAISVVLSGGTEMSLGTTDFQHVQIASEANASAHHEYGETDQSEDCHPGMACSLMAIGTQQKNITRTRRGFDVKPLTFSLVANRFTPEFDPPPPRRAV